MTDMPVSLPLAVGALLFAMAVAFVLYAARRERFLWFWALGWLAYSGGLLCVVLSASLGPAAGFRGIFDMWNILFLLFSAYAFARVETPDYWLRFALYLTIWYVIGTYYAFDAMSVTLPVLAFRACGTVVLARAVWRYWRVPRPEKLVSALLFLLWGFGTAALSVARADPLLEVLFASLLNYLIVVVFLRRTADVQEETEKNFRLIAENAADVIFLYTLVPAPAFTYVTPSAERITGYPVRDFYADPKFYLKLVPEQEFARISDAFEPSREPGGGSRGLVSRMVHSSGATFWAEMNTTVLYGADGAPVALEGIIRDISLMKSAEEELVASKTSRDRLLSYVSHELRIPLSSIIGYAEALRDGTIEPGEREGALEIIAGKAQSLSRLIDDLFQLSKLETGQFSFNFMIVDVQDLTEQLIGGQMREVAGTGLHLSTELDRGAIGGLVIADLQRIEQVMANLVRNAVRFSREGGRVVLRFAIDEEAQRYVVSVTDTGAGIAEADLPHVFDRFFTRTKASGGTGLGLTLCKEIVEAHKGEMTVQSREGSGSTFTFSIPLYFEGEGEGPAAVL
ncbi:MAG: PAS domain-containing sensor histidine kinase [Clostridiales Family XIII bacterium]|jgi:PAS domain S-box-containing protein|nr:PAS domain-containing sensor histidine kinase [Clostridiales Family XIII bacterium]